jgi:hypothetical protein
VDILAKYDHNRQKLGARRSIVSTAQRSSRSLYQERPRKYGSIPKEDEAVSSQSFVNLSGLVNAITAAAMRR